ncbi:MAG: efflux RND transporter periplasmic adaptor subunit, partial [Tannerella sp.]|nr:efflux RND transporter periplasmic adaptor subunit [Tannerella sp.]
MNSIRNKMLLLIGIAAFYACSSGERQEEGGAPVQVEIYSPAQVADVGFRFSGEVTAKQTATISTRMMGYVRKIYVKPGDRVSTGQLLVSISSDEVLAKKAQVQAMLTEAEAAAKNAQRDYERFQALHSQHSVSDKELENVTLQHTSMNAKVQMARQQLNEVDAMLAYSDIRAPFAGTVSQKMMYEGSMANPGMPILMMEQSGELQIVSSVSENYVPYIKVGDAAIIELKSLNMSIDG